VPKYYKVSEVYKRGVERVYMIITLHQKEDKELLCLGSRFAAPMKQ
jgi:hypothetical protein